MNVNNQPSNSVKDWSRILNMKSWMPLPHMLTPDEHEQLRIRSQRLTEVRVTGHGGESVDEELNQDR